jgi:peroxiredoxin Q/BCP
MYGKEYEGVLRTTYVIDEAGKILKTITKVKTKDHSAQILDELGI